MIKLIIDQYFTFFVLRDSSNQNELATNATNDTTTFGFNPVQNFVCMKNAFVSDLRSVGLVLILK